jgi:Skp family chaperone for outer membrane proteins
MEEVVAGKVATIARLEAEVAQLSKDLQDKAEELQNTVATLQGSALKETTRLEEQISALTLEKVSAIPHSSL